MASNKECLCAHAQPPCSPPFAMLWCRMRSDRSAHFTFRSSTQRRMRSGACPFRTDGDLERDSGLVRETRSVWAGSANKPGRGSGPIVQGGKGQTVRGEIPNSQDIAPGSLAGHISRSQARKVPVVSCQQTYSIWPIFTITLIIAFPFR